MKNKNPQSSFWFLSIGAILALVAVGFITQPLRADDPKATVVAAMQSWLQEIDANHYAQSWQDASANFRKAVTSDYWGIALNQARAPFGKCAERKLVTAVEQSEVPSPSGTQKGDFVVAKFDTTFDFAHVTETVCFEKEPDGNWRASGYYIKPNS